MSVLQRLAAAGLGARDARSERDACLAKAQPTGNCTSGLGLRVELADMNDADWKLLWRSSLTTYIEALQHP